MKNKSVIIVLIVILSLFAICLTIGMIVLMNKDFDFKFSFNFNETNANLVDSMTVDSKEIDDIKVFTRSTDIVIKESDKEIKIEYYSNSEKNPKIIKEGSNLVLNEKAFDTSCIGFCNINRKVVVYIPSDYVGKLDMNVTSGDITSYAKVLNNVSILSTSGDIKMLAVNNLYIKSTSGDIDINKVDGKLYLKTTSGDIDINTLNIVKNSSIISTSSDVDINNNTSGCYVEASTISGDIDINKSDRKSDLVLKIKTTSGDIDVD